MSLDERVLDLLPADGSWIRTQIIYMEAENSNVSRITVERKLEKLTANGLIERRQLNGKCVYYRRCEEVRMQRLMEEFVRKIEGSLSTLPAAIGDWGKEIEKELVAKGVSVQEAKAIAEETVNARMVQEDAVLRRLASVTFELMRANLPAQLMNEEFYIGRTKTGAIGYIFRK